MNDQPNNVASTEIKPAPRTIEQELLGIAADANELVTTIHAGYHADLNALIRHAIDGRPEDSPAELKDAA